MYSNELWFWIASNEEGAKTVSRINWVRLIGGVIASVIPFVTDGVFHEQVVNADWKALHDNLGIPEGKHSGVGVVYFAVFELGRGFVALFLYALMRAVFEPRRSSWSLGPWQLLLRV